MTNRVWIFSLAEFLINIARGTLVLALGMYLYTETGSLWALAANVVLEFAITLMLQGFAGSFVDRFGAKQILYIAMFSSVMIALVGGALIDWHLVIVLTLVIQVLNAFKPFVRNCVFTLVPVVAIDHLVEQLNARLSVALQAGQIVGMLMAGILISLGDVSLTLYFVGLMFLLALITFFLLFKNMAEVECSNGQAVTGKGSWKEAFAFVKGSPKAKIVLLTASFDFAAIALFNLMLAPVVKSNFSNQSLWLTILDMSFAIGAIIAGFLIVNRNWMRGSYYSVLSLLSGASVYLCFAFDSSSFLVLVAIFLFGIFITYSTVFWSSELQRLSPKTIKGRVSSLRYISNAAAVTIATSMVSLMYAYGFTIAAVSSLIICLSLSLAALYMGYWYESFTSSAKRQSLL